MQKDTEREAPKKRKRRNGIQHEIQKRAKKVKKKSMNNTNTATAAAAKCL